MQNSGGKRFGGSSKFGSSRGGGRKFGNSRDGPRRFGGGSGGGSGNFGGPREMHKAVCAECKNECEVPFKPTEGKPVFCRDCFQKRKPRY